ncbi:BglG family transcription antiterminator [Clostridium sp. MD294]|uniref:BglG family transcription antiterminator n=1 Tax=Clostridium sp. MD294 TaxID=97138 RepID=UPI0002CBCA40|nr:BglG family transcription antiterminator [Clostridium sp. MD294]NDO47535.1 BglG family transcription antiterminator [Clostridium sp. MD294]USF29391.1 putative licABCH operon regulator [Clostridium sp. MD294]
MNNYFAEDRKFLIIKLLQQNNVIALAELAQKLNVSTRTIRNDIKLLNELLEDAAFIEMEQGECRFYITDHYELEEKKISLEKMQRDFDSPQKRVAYIIKTLMTNDTHYSTEELAYSMNLGRTTLSNEIKKLNKVLYNYGLSIEGTQSAGIRLKGKEFQLRLFILENIYDILYEGCTIQENIQDSIITLLQNYGLESTTEKNFFQYVVISADRIQSGHSLDTMDKKFYTLQQSNAWNITQAVIKELRPLLKQDFNIEEKLFMTIPLAGMRTPTDLENISKMELKQNIEEVIEEIIERIGYELELYLKKENLQQDFYYHISFMVNRLQFGYMLKNPLAEEITKKYPLAYKMAKIAAKVVEQYYDVTVPEDEIGYITAYFGVYILEYSIVQQKPCRIALICSTGRGTARLIASQLKKLLDHNAEMDLYSEKQISVELLDSYDIVFSTIKIPLQTKKQIIRIKDIFDEKELLLHIQKVKYLEKVDFLGEETSGVSLIAALLEENTFFLLDEKKGYLDNTKMMIEHLTKQELVDKQFEQRILEREQNSTMVFGHNVAFPHAINEQREGKLVLALGVCAKNLPSENGEEVKLIFLLALPEQKELDDSVLVRIYDELISIAQNEEYIAEITKAESYKQLVRCFIKLGIGNLL